MHNGLLFLQKIDSCLGPNLKAMFTARVKVRRKDLLVLATKQQKCRGRALLTYFSKNFPIQLAWHTTRSQSKKNPGLQVHEFPPHTF